MLADLKEKETVRERDADREKKSDRQLWCQIIGSILQVGVKVES